MNPFRTIWSKLRSLARRGAASKEIDEELRFHLEQRTAENLAAGMSPEDAAREARRKFGSVQSVREECREVRGAGFGDHIWRDVRFGARLLARNPGFTAVAVFTLGLGIGANTAIFSVVEAVVLRPLSFRDPQQLVSIKCENSRLDHATIGVSMPELLDLRERTNLFAGISYVWPMHGNLTGGDRPERVEALAVSANYFRLLGRNAALGRTFGADEEQSPSWAEAAVISDGAWRRLFGGDPNVLDRKIYLDYDTYRIVGVMPSDFRHPGKTMESSTDVWITSGLKTGWGLNRNVRRLPSLIARLKPGVTLDEARTRLAVFAGELRRDFPGDYPSAAGWTPRVIPLQEEMAGKARPLLLTLFGAVGCVLLICCASIANLLLARASGRRRELAVRGAVGASRISLIRQLLTESLLLSMFGGLAGLLVSIWLTPFILRFAPADLPIPAAVGINIPVLGFVVLISLVTALLFGLVPALQVSRFNLVSALKESSPGAGQAAPAQRLRSLLVAGQIAVSVVLLAAAGLLLRSFWNVLQVNPGFNSHHVLVASLWLPPPSNPQVPAPYRTQAKRTEFVRSVLDQVRALPGVQSAAMGGGQNIPLVGWNSVSFGVEEQLPGDGNPFTAQATSVSPGFFQTLGLRLLAGRDFLESDDSSNRVAVVDETLARRFWSGSDPIGKRIRIGSATAPQWWVRVDSTNASWFTVVGVVSRMKTDAFESPDGPHIFFSIYQRSNNGMTVFVKSVGNPDALRDPLQNAVQAVDPDQPLFGMRTMDEIVSRSLAQRRFTLAMIGSFAVVALVLAGLGIYGVTALSVSHRTHEIGIRLALGADRKRIAILFLGHGLKLAAWGLLVGTAGSLMLTRWLSQWLFGPSPMDVLTYGVVATVLFLTTLVASWLPVRRAMSVDPMVALKCE